MKETDEEEIEIPPYPYIKETERGASFIRYSVIDTRSGETLAWMDESLEEESRLRKKFKSDDGSGDCDHALTGCTVLVTNISPDTTALEVAAHFHAAGDINGVEFDKEKHGQAVIKFKSKTGAENGAHLDNSFLNGVTISVSRGSRRSLPPQSVEFNNNSRVDHQYDEDSIYVGNIDTFAPDEELADHFRDVGDIMRLTRLKKNGEVTSNAYIQFREASSVGWALEMNGSLFRNFPLMIQRKKKSNK